MTTPYVPAAIPAAPAGTKTNTLWIWLVVVLPLVQLIPLLFIDWASLVSSPSSAGTSLNLITSPAYLLATLGGWVIYALCALCAYLDWKQLKAAGVPQPFHFAWVFLSYLVYVIGRSVVVKRRTGSGTAPMWAGIAGLVLSVAVAVYISVSMVSAMMATFTLYGS